MKERIVRIGGIMIGSVLLINAIVATILANFSTGILLTYAAGLTFLLIGCLVHFLSKPIKNLVCLLCAIATLLLTVFLLFLYAFGSQSTVSFNEDAVIVLGAGIRGEQLSDHLKNRLDAVIAYHCKNPNAIIVVSGGQGPQEEITEALAMERYLLSNGIPQEQIIKEACATSTFENFAYSKALLDRQFKDSYSAVFITNDYHVYRAEQVAKQADMYDIRHIPSSTPWFLVIPNGLRECLAVLKLWISQLIL